MTDKKHQKNKKSTEAFDPEAVLSGKSLFGLPFDEEQSEAVIIPVSWETTVSFREGTAKAPRAILDASKQIDFYDSDFPAEWKKGIFMLPFDKGMEKFGLEARKKAQKLIDYLEKGNSLPTEEKKISAWKKIDETSQTLNSWVKKEADELLKKNKIAGVLGGDHSSSLGLLESLSSFHCSFAILQIDAHLDLRDSYLGFFYSHASAMRRALEIKNVSKVVNVGARDYSEGEINFSRNSKDQSTVFSDRLIKEEIFNGKTWQNVCRDILETLPEKVYISFDIDGLDPKLCPDTGTPVPGGLEYEQAFFLIKEIVRSGRKIIGFDLSEVAPKAGIKDYQSDWNAIVGSRVLYRLAIAALSSK